MVGEADITVEGEGHEVVDLRAELPDRWDVNVSAWRNDSQTARFAEEGYQEPYTKFVKALTTKPMVGVGRYTSPDAMLRAVRQGIVDLIGAARPPSAAPFRQKTTDDGRIANNRKSRGDPICVERNSGM